MNPSSFIKINPADSVVVCLRPFVKGEQIEVDGTTVTLLQDTPMGHKVIIADTPAGTNIIKYGYPIGHALVDLKAGEWVNENNLKTNLSGTLKYEYHPVDEPLKIAKDDKTFNGYVRKNGEVGIRNEIWIVPTVGCVNGIAERLASALEAETHCEGIDAVHAWHHNYGCSQLSEDHENTRKVLRDIVLHPNAGGVLVLSLGCENNQPEEFMKLLGDYDTSRIRLMVTQKVEGDEMEEGMKILRELYAQAREDKREKCPLSHLRVGLKCGGSDPELFDQTVKLVNDFKEYFLSHGEPVGENPSPGNKAGGISTLEDKALGCTQKCGRAPVSGVLSYGDRLKVNGLNLLSAPGNDLVAATALASAGCQIVLFTTGRGTPFGTFIPTMKIATNSNLFAHKPNWIDFNAGKLVEGTSMSDLLKEFVEKIIAVANGEKTQNEKNGYREISIFKNGVTL